VVEKLARGLFRAKTELEMPFGAGFGASGAGALGCAYALNAHFDLGLTATRRHALLTKPRSVMERVWETSSLRIRAA